MSNSRALFVEIAILAAVGSACTSNTSLDRSGSGGAPAGAGGITAGGGAIVGGTVGRPAGRASGVGTGGAGGIDASPGDVPIGQDLGTGGMASGGGTGPAGGTGAGGVTSAGGRGGSAAGGTGAGGITSPDGVSGTGGNPCSRVPADDATCLTQYQRSLAYFCQVPAQTPSSDYVAYNAINSGDSYCCPSQYTSCDGQRPTPGTRCQTILGLTCTYGSDLDPTCRTSATCQYGSESYPTWQVPAVTCDSPTLGCPTPTYANRVCCPTHACMFEPQSSATCSAVDEVSSRTGDYYPALQFFGDSGIGGVGPWGADVAPKPVTGKFLNPSVNAGEPSFTV